MSQRIPRAAAILLAVLAFAAACSRTISVGATSPAATFLVNVTNAGPIDLAVSYDDGSGSRALGLVPAGRTERFIIAAPKRTTIRITGVTPDGTRTVSSVPVDLRAGAAVDVTLR
jgi:ABC-type glycerol-3-phosphate transport system substrate-binding protein